MLILIDYFMQWEDFEHQNNSTKAWAHPNEPKVSISNLR